MICFAAAGLLYLATCQRGASWQDSGMFQWRIRHGDYQGRLGLALAHPLYIAAGRVIARLFGRHFAFGLNFFSGMGMAVALANLAAVTAFITRRLWIGLATVAMLAVAHTVWWLSTIAEVYTWSVAGLTAELWLLIALLRRPQWRTAAGLAFVNGLGLCVHNFALLTLPVYLVTVVMLAARGKMPKWSLAAAAAAYVLGAGLYLGMTVDLAIGTGDLGGAISSALFGERSIYAGAVLGVGRSWRYLKFNAVLGALNFVTFLLPLAVVGWIRMRRFLSRGETAAIAAITAIHAVFVVRYPVPDQFTFLLPTLVMIALAAGVGAAAVADTSRGWRTAAMVACAVSVALPPAFYAAVPPLARALGVKVERARKLPRDEIRYWTVPWKHNEKSAELFAATALRQAEPNGVIIPDSTSEYVLVIVQRRDKPAPNVQVQLHDSPLPKYEKPNDRKPFLKALGGRELFLVSPVPGYAPAGLLADMAPPKPTAEGPLYKVRWKESPPAGA